MIRIGLMGFGRIGRNIFRILHNRDDIRVVAISDVADPKNLEYLLKYDTIMGRFPATVSVSEGHLYCYGRQIAMLSGEKPGDVAWGDFDVDIVIEATSKPRTRAEMEAHLNTGAQRVILCVPPVDRPDITVVMGVNQDQITHHHKVISNASITAHCAAPIMKIIDETFGIEQVFFSTVHAYTSDQRLADVPADSLRRSRAAHQNIIPVNTNSVALLEDLLPKLKGKIQGLAMKVPVPNGSLVDMTTFTRKIVTEGSINAVIQSAVASKYKRTVDYCTDPIVSSDVTKSPYSCTFDAMSTTVLGDRLVKTISWYDNGWGYAHRVVDLIAHLKSTEGRST